MSDTKSVFQEAISKIGDTLSGIMLSGVGNQASTPNKQHQPPKPQAQISQPQVQPIQQQQSQTNQLQNQSQPAGEQQPSGVRLRSGKVTAGNNRPFQAQAPPRKFDLNTTITDTVTPNNELTQYFQKYQGTNTAVKPPAQAAQTSQAANPVQPAACTALQKIPQVNEQPILNNNKTGMLEAAENLLFGLDEAAVLKTPDNANEDNRLMDNGPAKLNEALKILKELQAQIKPDSTAPVQAQQNTAPEVNDYTRNWAHLTSHANSSQAGSLNRTVDALLPETKRQKVLDSLKRDPIEQWSGETKLYAFLVTNTEAYLNEMSLTKAETAHAIAGVFKSSVYGRAEALRLAMLTLPDLVNSINDRKPTYKSIARALETGSAANFQPLKSTERLIDLFYRTRLVLECEMDWVEQTPWVEDRLNFLAMEKITDPQANLLPDQDHFHVQIWWKQFIFTQSQASGSVKAVSTSTVTNVLINMDRTRHRPSTVTSTSKSDH